MDNSILISIKKVLGYNIDDSFDTDIIIGINSALSTLDQLGVGPKGGFLITGESETWTDFLGDAKNLENVKMYVYLKTRLSFDPPQNSFLVNAIEKQISELEWRLNVACDKGETK